MLLYRVEYTESECDIQNNDLLYKLDRQCQNISELLVIFEKYINKTKFVSSNLYKLHNSCFVVFVIFVNLIFLYFLYLYILHVHVQPDFSVFLEEVRDGSGHELRLVLVSCVCDAKQAWSLLIAPLLASATSCVPVKVVFNKV